MEPLDIAKAARDACLRAAIDAYEDAGIRGVCEEGRWEAAIGAIRMLDLDELVAGSAEARDG